MQSFFHLILLRHQNTKTRCHKFSKNHWVMALFEIFRFAREKLQFTVALDHPVSILATALPQCQHLDNCSKRWNVSHLTPATLALCLLQHPNVVWKKEVYSDEKLHWWWVWDAPLPPPWILSYIYGFAIRMSVRLSVCPSVRLSGSETWLMKRQSSTNSWPPSTPLGVGNFSFVFL